MVTLLPDPNCVLLREQECPQVQKEELHDIYTRHSCQIRVSNPRPHSQYTVTVRPRNGEKFIRSANHSESVLLPRGLSPVTQET